MANLIITLFLVGFGCSVLTRFLLLLDINKRVYNHMPGACRVIRGTENGSVAIKLLRELKIALITSGYARTRGVRNCATGVLIYDFANNQNHNVQWLTISGIDLNKFTPNGIDAYVSKGRVTIYIVNGHSVSSTIEIFQLRRERLTLIHRKTISDPMFVNTMDITVVGADRFFITNYGVGRARWMQLIETAIQSSFGSIVYFNGKNGTFIERYFPSANGIAVDRQLKYLFVASSINEFIQVYKLERDMSVSVDARIPLLSSPNKLFVNENDDIWTALSPVLYKTEKHMQNPVDSSQRPPSQVLRIRIQSDRKSWTITEPYANDGATIWGSSAVVFFDDQMLIGSLFGRLLHCDIDYPKWV